MLKITINDLVKLRDVFCSSIKIKGLDGLGSDILCQPLVFSMQEIESLRNMPVEKILSMFITSLQEAFMNINDYIEENRLEAKIYKNVPNDAE